MNLSELDLTIHSSKTLVSLIKKTNSNSTIVWPSHLYLTFKKNKMSGQEEVRFESVSQ